ncbi:putative ZDHHC-type palmitoyltransferase 6 [Haliotis rufescens]|uniref:putative ZDHHC-type palmitoyltransferase 6 n=1 Tax=Haliotis rufescens TaxID=6454 RepID=UPI001EB013D4|nr:putative ZDHHC-type palmitoyltransferase 6 [Haliotis rufescens]
MTDDPMRFAHSLIPNPNIPPDYNILANAISNCSGPVVHQMLKQNPDLVNLKAWHGQTALHRACLGGNSDIVGLLLQAGSNPNEPNDFDETPLHYAAKRGNLQVFQMLVQFGGDATLTDKNGKGMIHHSAETGTVYMLHYLWEVQQLSLSDPDAKRLTPLHIVCKHGQVDSLKYLLKKGRCNLYATDCEGNTAVHMAVQEGHSYMTWLLLEVMGTKVLNVTNNEGYTPGDLATMRDKTGHRELVPLLKQFRRAPTAHPRGPVLKWYFYLLLPAAAFAVSVLVSKLAGDKYQGVVVFGGLGAVLFHLRDQMHRFTDISRWPNPVHAGTFAAGLFHTAFYFFVAIMPYMTQHLYIMCLTPMYAVGLVYLYWTILFTDPGSVSQSEVDEKTLKPLTILDLCLPGKKLEQFCIFCEIVRPPRTKHCRLCNKCFRDMDHHCLFLLQCIAQKNHLRFLWFIALNIIAMVIFLAISTSHLFEIYPKLTIFEIGMTLFHSNAWHLSLIGLNMASIFWGVNLLLFQFRMVGNGFTTFYQPKQNVDVLTSMEKCMNVVYFLLGRRPFARNPFLGKEMNV